MRLMQLLLPRVEFNEFSSAVHQRERDAVLRTFASSSVPSSDSSGKGTTSALKVLVASDAMARGMDVDGITSVINYDPPGDIKAYVHRVGRTARAGKAGTSYTLLRSAEVHHFKKNMARATKPWKPLVLPGQAGDMAQLDREYKSALEDLDWVLEQERAKALKYSAPREAVQAGLLELRQLGRTSTEPSIV